MKKLLIILFLFASTSVYAEYDFNFYNKYVEKTPKLPIKVFNNDKNLSTSRFRFDKNRIFYIYVNRSDIRPIEISLSYEEATELTEWLNKIIK